jgi:hypothetical protein
MKKIPAIKKTSLHHLTHQREGNPMQNTDKNIRILRDKLSRIGIAEKQLDDETILSSYGINKYGQICGIQKTTPPAP